MSVYETAHIRSYKRDTYAMVEKKNLQLDEMHVSLQREINALGQKNGSEAEALMRINLKSENLLKMTAE